MHEAKPLNKEVLELANHDSLITRLLSNRNVENLLAANYYLDLKAITPSPSSEIPEMDKAFERVSKAIDSKEKIYVYGDYDVDGTTSVALLFRAFKMIGIKADYYVPNRHSEGYGLNTGAVQKIKDSGADLLITCDCGISNYDEVDFANSINLDVIVTDHHSIPKKTPPSIANCNPKTLPEDHPLHWLPGVGVAYKLAELILEKYIEDKAMSKAYIESLLDLVALGMIADLAPLRAENRYLVNIGLKVLAKTEKPGLQELMRVCGIRVNPDAEHIGFGIAPRINAAGRLADAGEAVELMITEDRSRAEELAGNLDSNNKERQVLCEETLEESLSLIGEKIDLSKNCLALYSKNWNHGVIGIVASRLVERFYMPTFMMAVQDDVTKGSSRGINIPSLDLFEEMNIIQEKTGLFLKYGGHKAAAGFSCKVEDTEKLAQTLMDHFQKRLANEDMRKPVKVDVALKLNEINSGFVHRLGILAPYGFENPQPVFISGDLEVTAMRDLGRDGKHLKLFLKDETVDRPIEAVIWNRAKEFMTKFGGKLHPKVTFVYSAKINDFNGERLVQLDIRDWKDPSEVNEAFFDRFKKKVYN